MSQYPIVLELSERRVVVVGLGAVGRRKAVGLSEAGARVLGVDPAGGGGGLPEGITIRPEAFRPEHLDGALLAFASATPEVNRAVVDASRHRGILVNAASDPEGGDFALPAVHRDGGVVLAVATAGAGPALASNLRDRASEAIGSESGRLAAILAELRPIVLARVADAEARRRLFRAWADLGWLDRLKGEGEAAVREAMLRDLERIIAGRWPG